MTPLSERSKRAIAAAPVLAAIVFQALAAQQWIISAAAAATLLICLYQAVTVTVTLRRIVYISLIGGIIGMVSTASDTPAVGLLPPIFANALTWAGMVLAIFMLLGRNLGAAWGCAWLVVALSAFGEPTSATLTALGLFLISQFGAAAYVSGVFEEWPRVFTPLVLYASLVVLSTLGFSAMTNRLDGALNNLLEGMFLENNLPQSTGIGEEIHLSSRSSVKLSLDPLAELSEQAGYLRVNVMDRFDGVRWFPSSEIRSQRYPIAKSPASQETSPDLEIFFYEDPGRKLPAVAGTRSVDGADAEFEGGWVLRGELSGTSLRYTVADAGQLPAEPSTSSHLLELPDNLREPLTAATDRIVAKAESDREKANAITNFFHSNFQYSLQTNLLGAKHPLLELIEDRRPAYCVYFASAMAAMLRTQGIPARVVSGYLPLETNPLSGRVTIRKRDSHAWVEVWVAEEERFVAYDPTPGNSRSEVVGLSQSPGLISSTFAAVGSWLWRQWMSFRDDPSALLRWISTSPLTWIAIAVGLLVLWRRRKKSLSVANDPAGSVAVDPELRQAYLQYLKSLRRVGIERRPAETDEELIARLRERGHLEQAEKASIFVHRYRRMRFRGEAWNSSLVESALAIQK